MKTASHYEKKDGNVQCFLCPHHCIIKPGKVGLCQVRRNENGILMSLNYGMVSSAHMDPIEKKPLYNFYPGYDILSLGTLGCNLSCSFCQNWQISQLPREKIDNYFMRMSDEMTPSQVGQMAEKYGKQGSIGIAYTYNEPSIWYEFVLESAREVKNRGYKNVLVTNGFLDRDPLRDLLPFIDAANVDIKSMSDGFYKKICGGRLAPVLEYAKMAKEKCHVEITNLIVTGENDSREDLGKLVDFVSGELGRDTPIHFSRYHPAYQFDAPATPVEKLEMAYEIASGKLDYVYVGNIWDNPWDNTLCPKCHSVVIKRIGFNISSVNLKEGNKCAYCGAEVAIVGEYAGKAGV